MKSAPSLSFEPHPSRVAQGLTALIGVVAMGAISFSGLPDGPRLGIVALVGTAMVMALRKQFASPATSFTLQAEGTWLIHVENSDHAATLARSHDLGFLIALHFRTDSGRRVDLALWPDSLPAETRRRLRVWLRRQGTPY